MSEQIFSQKTINFSLELIFFALKTNNLAIQDEADFLVKWLQVNWSSKNSIRQILPYIERAYNLTLRSEFSPHRELDASLASDGYRIRNGKLGQPQVIKHDAEKKEGDVSAKGLYESRKNMISDIEPSYS